MAKRNYEKPTVHNILTDSWKEFMKKLAESSEDIRANLINGISEDLNDDLAWILWTTRLNGPSRVAILSLMTLRKILIRNWLITNDESNSIRYNETDMLAIVNTLRDNNNNLIKIRWEDSDPLSNMETLMIYHAHIRKYFEKQWSSLKLFNLLTQ